MIRSGVRHEALMDRAGWDARRWLLQQLVEAEGRPNPGLGVRLGAALTT